jgi:DNA-binding NarL/FixJ family response regulator
LATPAYEQAMASARTKLGESAFVAAWDAGQHVAWDDLGDEADASVEDTPWPSKPCHLTRREGEVLLLLVEGRSNRAIADELSISERTVENHVFHILTKLGQESRTAAATFALRHGLA